MDAVITWLQNMFKDYKNNNPDSALWCVQQVFRWEPNKIPLSSMPCIFIQPVTTPYTFNVWYVQRQFSLRVWFIDSIKRHLEEWRSDVVWVTKNVVRVVEGANNNTWKILDDTIVWLLYKVPCITIKDDDWNDVEIAHDIQNIVVEYEFLEGEKWEQAYQWTVTFDVAAAWPTF